MAVSPAHVVLYASEPADFQIALSAATAAGISPTNVCGDFYTAWKKVASGSAIVIAVGASANNALYFNPCGWANPAGTAAGSTPFIPAGAPQDTLHGANYYLNGAGQTGVDTLRLTVMLSYYATHGRYPQGFGSQMPRPLQPVDACRANMTANQVCPC